MESVLALSLGIKGGSIIYGAEIIQRLTCPVEAIAARGAVVQPKMPHREWLAHRNSKEFMLFSIFLLPWYLVRLSLDLLQGRYCALYLPYLHFWSIFFIGLFKFFGKKVIITVHDGVLHGKNKTIPGIQLLTNTCIKLADELIFLSDYVRQGVKTELDPLGNYHLIPHGLIIPNSQLEMAPREHPTRPKILFFGKVLASKGIENLIQACLELPTDKYDRLQIVGKHFYPLQVPDSPQIEVVDKFVAEAEISNYFNDADILVLPYTAASQSGVVTIAIAACLPMVCSQIGGLKEQLTPEEAVFVEPNSAAIKQGILQLISDRERYATISQNLHYKQAQLSWLTITDRVEQVIVSACK